MIRLKELIDEYRQEHGIFEAKRMAKKERIDEMISGLCECELTTEEKFDRIITVLELMNTKVYS